MSSVRNEEIFGRQHHVLDGGVPSEKQEQIVETDIAIIGAGIGGCIAALALSPHLSVTLVDIERSQYTYLGETLPCSARHILEKLDLEDVLNAHLGTQQGLVSDWGNESIHTLGCLKDPDGLGWMVNHNVLEQQLRESVTLRGVSDLQPLSLERSILNEDKWQLLLRDEGNQLQQTLNAKVVIEATGRQATFAKQQGAKYEREDSLVSVWMTYRSNATHETSSVHPSENGWWYCSPIPESSALNASKNSNNQNSQGTLMLLSYQTDSDLLDTNLAQSTDALLAEAQKVPELADALASRMIGSEVHSGVKNVNSSRLLENDANNWFAVGDAAMSLDPLSSQALFHAMASAMQLSELILKFGIDSEVGKTAISFEFQQLLERIWHQFEAEKLSYYAQERRWSDAIFWERRAA